MPTPASGCWRVATGFTGETCVYLSVGNIPGVGGGGVVEFPLLIEILLSMAPGAVSHAETESQ
jgi:hypothetical protein